MTEHAGAHERAREQGATGRRRERRHPLRWTGLSARQAAAVIGGAVILLLCLATLGAAWLLRQRAIEDWRSDMSSLSLVLAENVSQTMASTYLVLDGLTDVVHAIQLRAPGPLAAATGTEQLFQTMRDKISGLPQVDVATVADADGTVLNFTRSYPPPPINLADRDYFAWHRAHADSAPFLSQPVRNKGNGKWTFYVSRRLNDAHGRFAGVVLVGVSCDFFSQFFRNVSLGEHAAISLYRRDQTLLARWPHADQLMGKRFNTGNTSQVLAQGLDHDVRLATGPREAAGGQAVYRMGAVRLVRNYPLVINATITEELLLAGYWRNLRLLGGIALGSLVALSVAFWMMGQLLKRREQDAEQARALMRMADAASEAKSRFLAMMSHEIRTPMNAIVGMSELMLGTRLDATQRGYARNVHSGVLELMQIINEVLDFSKIESGRMELVQGLFDPAEPLRQVAALHQASAQAKGLQLEVRVGSCPRKVYGDAARLRQVLGNLVSNAIKFTPSGGVSITLEARPEEGRTGNWRLCYAVRDSGIGMDAEAQHRLFEPFIQADSTISRQYGGTGLGLAICRRLVRLMGGHIECSSAPGDGSVFRVELPCRLHAPAGALGGAVPDGPPAPPPETSVADRRAPAGAGWDGAQGAVAGQVVAAAAAPRVLLAEDTEMNRQLARILLTRLGCEVDEAINGQLALEALETARYDLVLMDCMMPVLDGYEACRRLRQREAETGAPRLPVIALTASAIEGDRQRCLAAGMDDYLSKPFTAAEFSAMVVRWGRLPCAPPAVSSPPPSVP
ncbi:response regulator [Duganella sp. FT3S]|uniref:Virulence sensor protein BvgS n=1 Tax=Rugamonas fusca TaxID=2758568 RepID=A0A7W2I4U7_9BURK|nr:hybrid sensor histidine kinase/response regulator [Rugamonas fusca]MBA5603769.1 response regulator [Rugamonas fusca]